MLGHLCSATFLTFTNVGVSTWQLERRSFSIASSPPITPPTPTQRMPHKHNRSTTQKLVQCGFYYGGIRRGPGHIWRRLGPMKSLSAGRSAAARLGTPRFGPPHYWASISVLCTAPAAPYNSELLRLDYP